MGQRAWKQLTVLGPSLTDRPGVVAISNPLLKKRVQIDRDALLDMFTQMYEGDRLEDAPGYEKLVELGFLTDQPESPELQSEIAHWESRGWDPALDYYLWSRNGEYADVDPNPEIRREALRRYLHEAPPPEEIPFPAGTPLVPPAPLPTEMTLGEVAMTRRTVRRFATHPITEEQFSSLLWYGLERVRGVRQLASQTDPVALLRSFGIAFDFYIAVFGVQGLENGAYRYSVLDHAVSQVTQGDLRDQVTNLLFGQTPPTTAAFTLFVAADLPRYAWRYRHERALRHLYIDAGRIGQELLLVARVLNMGGFPTPAVRDREAEKLLRLVDGRQSLVYTITFGELPRVEQKVADPDTDIAP